MCNNVPYDIIFCESNLIVMLLNHVISKFHTLIGLCMNSPNYCELICVSSDPTVDVTPDVLNQAVLPVISRSVCSLPTWYGDQISDSMFCAGYTQGGKDGCQVSQTRTPCKSFMFSLLRPLVWIAKVPYKSIFSAEVFIWSYRLEPAQSLRSSTHVRFGLLFLACLAMFLLLFSVEYHNALMCFSLRSPHKTYACTVRLFIIVS